MQGKHLYEYAIIRVVPRVEREEFINVGVLLCSKKDKYLKCMVYLDERKIKMLDPDVDLDLFRSYMDSILEICNGEASNHPISFQDAASRFRWLTAARSSMIQTSNPHSGLSDDLDKTLNDLYRQYIK